PPRRLLKARYPSQLAYHVSCHMPQMIDTHVHLNHSDFADDTPEAILRALQAGVEGLVVVGYDLDSNRDAAALAAAHPQVWASVGLHPHCAANLDQRMLEE